MDDRPKEQADVPQDLYDHGYRRWPDGSLRQTGLRKGEKPEEPIHGYDPNKEYELYHYDAEDGRAHYRKVKPPSLWQRFFGTGE
jgi:hypothetical protein